MKNYKLARRTLAVLLTALMITSIFAMMPAMALESSKVYTLDADFDEGTLVGVEHDTVSDQLQLSTKSTTLPFIWVPNSNEGTISKYDTVTGKELGRYRTGPNSYGNPSRTTVDLDGNVWFGNRGTGTAVKIGLSENGQYIDRNGNGVMDTSTDLNNDGKVTGAEVLGWMQDECMLYEVLLGYSSSGPRGFAIDANNDLWAGTYYGRKYYHIDGATGAIIAADTISIPSGAYGALIDGNGMLWSSTLSNHVLKIDPVTKSVTTVYLSHTSYGLGIDQNDHLFVSGWGSNKISKIDINTNAILKVAPQGYSSSRGVAVTDDGDVWVANSYGSRVTRLSNDLTIKTYIIVGSTPTGVAVDAAGKVWACNYGDGKINRINPATNSIDFTVTTPGIYGGTAYHYSYSDMTGIIARTVTTQIGTWTVDFDSEGAGTEWGKVSWNSNEPAGTSVTVKVRSSDDQSTWSSWETATDGVSLSTTPDGRYLQVETKLQISSGDTSPILYDLSVEVAGTESIALSPGSAVNDIGTSHTVTATVLDATGSPIEGRDVTFEVTSGPNVGQGATVSTDANGEATFTYTGATVGTDTIEATMVDNTQTVLTSNQVTKKWVDPNAEIPEFPTIAIPVLSIIGLMFIMGRRRD